MAPRGKILTRKNRRKEERAAKKQRRVQYYSRQVQNNKTESKGTSKKTQYPPLPIGHDTKAPPSKKKAWLIKANEKEQKEISKLEKLLKINKRKKDENRWPNSFHEDGLDYLLDLTEKGGQGWNLSDDYDSDSDKDYHLDQCSSSSDSEPEEYSMHTKFHPSSTGCGKVARSIMKKRSEKSELNTQRKTVQFSKDVGKELLEEIDGEEDDDENMNTGDEVYDSNEDIQYEEEEKIEDKKEEPNEEVEESDGYLESSGDEDIPMSVRGDEVAGGQAKYIPPHLSVSGSSQWLRKRVQGLLNRLSESNMKSISTQLEQLYSENSRNDMNATLWVVLERACIRPVLISDRFAMEQAMLVAILHNHVGTEVGAYVIQSIATKLESLLHPVTEEKEEGREGEGKEAECLLLLLSHLYNYRVVHCLLVYDVIRTLVESFTERDIELLLLLLKNTGMEIRRDDARALKDIIMQIQSKSADSALSKSPRVKFMLETISALKTNNARKIPNYDPSLLEHMKKLLRGLLRTSGSLDEAQLKVSLQDLLNAGKQGRWWMVGSAWTGRNADTATCVDTAKMGVDCESWVLELARKQCMNTDIRRTIFGVIMASEDYIDGFQKLVKLGLKDVQEREVIHVLLDCCLQESQFNPYYSYLGQKLCEWKKANQVTFQYSLWDRLKTLDSLTPTNLINLRKLCCHLITKKALSLSILKIVDFMELSKCGINFYKSLLLSLLSESSESVVREVFSRISPLPHLKKLRDALLVFINHFIADSQCSVEQEFNIESKTLISQRVEIAERALRVEGELL